MQAGIRDSKDITKNQVTQTDGQKSPTSPKRSRKRIVKRIGNESKSTPNMNNDRQRIGSRQDIQDNPIYAGLQNEENDIDQQGYFGPWVRKKERPATRLNSRRQSGNLVRTPINQTKRLRPFDLTKSQKIRHVRSISVLNRIGGIIDRPQNRNMLTPKQLEIQKRNTTFHVKKIQPTLPHPQPLRVSEVLYMYKSTDLKRNSNNTASLEKLRHEAEELDYRLKIRRYLNHQNASPLISRAMFNLTKRLKDEKTNDVEHVKSTVLTGAKAKLFDFNRIQTNLLRYKHSQPKAPIISVQRLFNMRRNSDNSFNKSFADRFHQDSKNPSGNKFSKILFTDKYRSNKHL